MNRSCCHECLRWPCDTYNAVKRKVDPAEFVCSDYAERGASKPMQGVAMPDFEKLYYEMNEARIRLTDTSDKLEVRIDELETELAKRQWVSVEDRLPETHGEYIVKTDAYYERNVITAWFDLRFLQPRVTHWMPLPEPPK